VNEKFGWGPNEIPYNEDGSIYEGPFHHTSLRARLKKLITKWRLEDDEILSRGLGIAADELEEALK